VTARPISLGTGGPHICAGFRRMLGRTSRLESSRCALAIGLLFSASACCRSAPLGHRYGNIISLGTPDSLFSFRGGKGIPDDCSNPTLTLSLFRGLLDDTLCEVSPSQTQVIRYVCRYPESSPRSKDCKVVEDGVLWAQFQANASTYFDIQGTSSHWLECRGANYALEDNEARITALRKAREIQARCEPR
jgi:hypothetical protein